MLLISTLRTMESENRTETGYTCPMKGSGYYESKRKTH